MQGETHVPAPPSGGGPASVEGAVQTQHAAVDVWPMVQACPCMLQLLPVLCPQAEVASATDTRASERAKRR